MKKTLILFGILAVLFVQNVSAQQLGDVYTDRNGTFTISMPRGWQTIEAGGKYLSVIGPVENGFTPNMAFTDEGYSGTIASYVDLALPTLPMIFQGFTLLSRTSFRTNAGVNGEAITYLVTVGQFRIRIRQYIIPNRSGNMVMVITGGAPEQGGERFDAIFDASARTFNWTR